MENKTKFGDFKFRLLSTLVLLPVVIWITVMGNQIGLYLVLLVIISYFAAKEWANMCGGWSFSFDGMTLVTFVALAVVSFYMNSLLTGFIFIIMGIYLSYLTAKLRANFEKKLHVIPSYLNRPLFFGLGAGYLGLCLGSLAYLRNLDSYNMTTLWVFGLVVCNDVSAYIFGSLIGGKKLAPKISPGKTWSGFIAALIVNFIVSYIVAGLINLPHVLDLSIFGALMAVAAHIGDLLESALKRYLQVKDSGILIPGHGGMLDRIDALMFVSLVAFIIISITGKSILVI